MASIYLIRHGQASFGQDDYDQLSSLGHEQAKIVGQSLARRIEGFDCVVTGTMQRHQQTADGCLQAFPSAQPEVWQEGGWNEYDHDDILRGIGDDFVSAQAISKFIARQQNPKQAFEDALNKAMNRWMSGQYDSDYVESWPYYQQRIHDALNNIVERARSNDSGGGARLKNVAVFTSGGVISVIAQALLGVSSDKMMHMNWTLMNCAITKLVVSKDRLFVATLNDHVHFELPELKQFLTYK
ncbi:MAG TPA: histidine phosphatase family protein [Gammaproteobacteria bacterium]|nr:histidine phosphatase family protein [Gammaproteobacteria bacterium]